MSGIFRRTERESRLRRGERGQALVVMVGGLIALMVGTGLVIDGGLAFVTRRDGQNDADLAALAGTQVVVTYYTVGGVDGADVYDAVERSVAVNDCANAGNVPCTWTARYVKPGRGIDIVDVGPVLSSGNIPTGAQGVQVTVTQTPPTYFLGVIGQTNWTIGSTAAAMTAGKGKDVGPGGLLPIAIDYDAIQQYMDESGEARPFQNGDRFLVSQGGKDAPGNFSWLAWWCQDGSPSWEECSGSNDAGSLADSICVPDSPEMHFDSDADGIADAVYNIDGDPGKTNASRVRTCLQKYIEAGQAYLAGECNPQTECPPIMLPLWTLETNGQGNSTTYRISGIVEAYLVGYQQKKNPAIDELEFVFVENGPLDIAEGAKWGPPPCNALDPACADLTVFIGLVI